MKIDVIVTWPKNNDYPLWRDFIHKNRKRFGKVIVCFMESNSSENYREFVMQEMEKDNITFLLSPPIGPDQDWRDVAVNHALQHSDSEWIWFTEQDFFTQGDFWKNVYYAIDIGEDAIGVLDGQRLHPCSLFIKRSVLDETSKFFGIKSGVYDHFGKVQGEPDMMRAAVCVIGAECYKHYAGLSQNFYLLSIGEQPNYKPEEFTNYINQCFECGVNLDPQWVKTAQKLKL